MSKKVLTDLDLSKNEIQNVAMQNVAGTPASPVAGQFWFNTSNNTPYYFDGTNASAFGATYTLPAATTTTLGGVIVGTNISVANDGTISVADASTSAKGLIEIATDAEATTGTSEVLAVNPKQLATKVTANASITAGTATKITYDSKGLVTGGASLVASDIPDISATYVPQTAVGSANGVASLDGDGKVPAAQLPSYVDDIVEAYIVSGATALSAGWLSKTSGGSALTPETGIIYVVLTAGEYQNRTFRWGGSTYVEISSAPGQATESTAGIAAIATQSEVTTGTNDTKIVTPLKLATAISGMVKGETFYNVAMVPSGGVCTWTITTTLAPNCICSIREASTGNEVLCDISFGSGTVTIKMNSSVAILVDTYIATIIGGLSAPTPNAQPTTAGGSSN